MSSETTMITGQYRLQEWATQVRECQSRPAGMSVEVIQKKMPVQQVVPVQPELLQQQEQKGSNAQAGLDISTKGFSVHVTESTPMPLLAAVLGVIRDAE